jgi:hypothetical protein
LLLVIYNSNEKWWSLERKLFLFESGGWEGMSIRSKNYEEKKLIDWLLNNKFTTTNEKNNKFRFQPEKKKKRKGKAKEYKKDSRKENKF